MKRIISLLLMLTLWMGMAQAGGIETVISDEPDRELVKKTQQEPLNPAIPGESPVTGLPWEGEYLPFLVQIDNDKGGVDKKMQPWGARYADVVYETPLYKNGATRISYLVSDTIPEAIGPVRSARVGHVWLWYEWRGGFLFYGGQEAEGSNINTEFNKLGYKVNDGAPLFSGIVGSGKPWKKFYTRIKGRAAPHNVTANPQGMRDLFPADYEAPMRPFLFTDELPQTGDWATQITIEFKNRDYHNTFVYDEATHSYLRSVRNLPYVDADTGEQLTFSNVIVQRMGLRFNNGAANPVTSNVGAGNCEIFMGGRYIPGYWVRATMDDRTVYYDQDGNELKFQRGRTYIAFAESDVPVVYSAD